MNAKPQPIVTGDMARRIATLDSPGCPLGARSDWPVSLSNAVDLLLPAAVGIVLFWGPDHIAFYNDAYAPAIGAQHPAALGRPAREGWAALWDELEPLLRGVRETGETFADRDRALRMDGHGPSFRFDISCSAVRDDDGTVGGVLCIIADTTDRHATETRLVFSEETLRLATDSAEIGTWDVDLIADTLIWSDRTKAMFGFAPDSHCTLDDFYAGLHPDDYDVTTARFAEALDPAIRARYDVEYRAIGAQDGIVRWLSAKGRGLFDGNVCVRAVGTTIDISERRRAQDELRESEARFRQLADTAPALIWVTDTGGDVLFANQAFETLLGLTIDGVMGQGWRTLIAGNNLTAFAERATASFRAHRPWSTEFKVRDATGATRWLHGEGRPRFHDGVFQGNIGCAVDVTEAHLAGQALERIVAERTGELADSNAALIAQIAERERVEAALHQMQRLEAVGQLTSGVAHDFNNLLTVILGNITMLQRTDAGIDDKGARRIDHIRTAAERGAALTAQLLAFSRRQRLEAKTIDLNATVTGMRELLTSSIGNAITIDLDLAPDLWPALVDPTQIELIILNLAINARDAMAVGGTVTIATANQTRGEPERVEDPPAGDHVVVTVADNGSGMSGAVLAKVFEPFFTTKEVGRGSGLGLAQVFGFVKQSGGGVRIDTLEGEGTRVAVYLPRSMVLAERVTDGVAVAEASIEGVRVLVVDDERDVRTVTAETLADAGGVVIEADSAGSALAQIEAGLEVDVILADFAMPGMNGAELAAEIARRWPRLPLLILTGYADLTAIADVADDAVIQKPFQPADLRARVRRAIDTRSER